MAITRNAEARELFIGKLSYGADLLDEITALCREKDIRLGRLQALGAVQKARIGFYNQQTRKYQFLTFDQPMEISNLIGNVSIKDATPFVHAHITLTDDTGKAYGGHLATGTIVFACEFVLQSFDGPVFERQLDCETGLPLWNMRE